MGIYSLKLIEAWNEDYECKVFVLTFFHNFMDRTYVNPSIMRKKISSPEKPKIERNVILFTLSFHSGIKYHFKVKNQKHSLINKIFKRKHTSNS